MLIRFTTKWMVKELEQFDYCSYLHEAVLGAEILDDGFFFLWVLDHLFKRAAAPIPVEALADDQVVIGLVLREEGLREAPGTLRSRQLLCVECAPGFCLEKHASFLS